MIPISPFFCGDHEGALYQHAVHEQSPFNAHPAAAHVDHHRWAFQRRDGLRILARVEGFNGLLGPWAINPTDWSASLPTLGLRTRWTPHWALELRSDDGDLVRRNFSFT